MEFTYQGLMCVQVKHFETNLHGRMIIYNESFVWNRTASSSNTSDFFFLKFKNLLRLLMIIINVKTFYVLEGVNRRLDKPELGTQLILYQMISHDLLVWKGLKQTMICVSQRSCKRFGNTFDISINNGRLCTLVWIVTTRKCILVAPLWMLVEKGL